jgi:hypothetical protein
MSLAYILILSTNLRPLLSNYNTLFRLENETDETDETADI